MTPTSQRSMLGTGQSTLLLLLAVAILMIGVAEWLEGLHQAAEMSPIEAALPTLVAWIYAATGIIAIVRRPGNQMGAILLLGSLSVLAGGLSVMVSPALWGVGIVTGTTILAAMVHALHAFPTGNLRGRWSVATVTGAWVVSLVMQLPIYLYGPFTPLASGPDEAMLELAVWCQRGAGLAVMVSTAALLATRVRNADRRQRRVLAPLYLYGIAAVLLVLLAARIFESVDPLLRMTIQMMVIAGIPLAFLVALLRGGFARTGRLDELSAQLATAPATRQDLVRSLAATLGDPTSDIAYWSDALGDYVDDGGVRIHQPDGRGLVEVSIDGRRVGAISYDELIVGERTLVESVARFLALSIDRQRLGTDLLASREELRASRERILTAADAERRRIARDLHDGLQVRLVLIALAADEAKRSGDAAALGSLQSGIDQAIGDLRSFVHGVMPATLTERGLASAIRELADSVTLPVELDLRLGSDRLGPAVETAAFMVVSEAVGNALKHAAASTVRLSAARDNNALRLSVRDDGIGGATLSLLSGLGGLRDRVEALGGDFTVSGVTAGGTIVEAVFPLHAVDVKHTS